MKNPFDAALQAAETFADPQVKSKLLGNVARLQSAAGQYDAVLQTLRKIPLPLERRIALLSADFRSFPPEKTGQLLELLKCGEQTAGLTGRLIVSMAETGNVAAAWKIIETAEMTFESDKQRYEFLEAALLHILPKTDEKDWKRILSLQKTFSDELYQDWAALAAAKHLFSHGEKEEAEKTAESVSPPLRRSWVFYEISRMLPAGVSSGGDNAACAVSYAAAQKYTEKAAAVLESFTLSPENQKETETAAVAFRIIGQALCRAGSKETGGQLLEKSEAAAAQIKLPVTRCRLQCFLGKVLREEGMISSVQDYLPVNAMMQSLSSGFSRSQLLVWLAEAGWEEGWTNAAEAAAQPERGIPEQDRAERVAEILQRFSAHRQKRNPSGDPKEDSVTLSGEEWETFYFSPFAAEDCGC